MVTVVNKETVTSHQHSLYHTYLTRVKHSNQNALIWAIPALNSCLHALIWAKPTLHSNKHVLIWAERA